jgi:phage shock protein A
LREVYPGLEHNKLPDPEERAIQSLADQMKELEKRINSLETELEKTKKENKVLKVVKTK